MTDRRALRVAAAYVVTLAVLVPGASPAVARPARYGLADEAGRTTQTRVGVDISWPECPPTMGISGNEGQDKPMPSTRNDFVVIGLTNGPAFTPNPCLRREARWARRNHVDAAAYAVTTDPTRRHLRRYGRSGPYSADTVAGRLRNVGWHQARYNLARLREAGLASPIVWIDVEDSHLRVWPRTPHRNRNVVAGLLRGYGRAGYAVGFYSTPYYWTAILGRARYGLPEWRTAGETTRRAAARKCRSDSFQGGRAVLAQWWTPRKDHDLVCRTNDGSSRIARWGAWFHRY